VSAWRLALKGLHEAGGIATNRQFGCRAGRCELVRRGLAVCHNRIEGGYAVYLYSITPSGQDVADGRVVVEPAGPRPMRYVATWLKSLPQLRLTA
jgi:hypothetical protein